MASLTRWEYHIQVLKILPVFSIAFGAVANPYRRKEEEGHPGWTELSHGNKNENNETS